VTGAQLKQPFSFYSVAGVFVGMQCDIEFLCDHTLYRNKHKADARKFLCPLSTNMSGLPTQDLLLSHTQTLLLKAKWDMVNTTVAPQNFGIRFPSWYSHKYWPTLWVYRSPASNFNGFALVDFNIKLHCINNPCVAFAK